MGFKGCRLIVWDALKGQCKGSSFVQVEGVDLKFGFRSQRMSTAWQQKRLRDFRQRNHPNVVTGHQPLRAPWLVTYVSLLINCSHFRDG